MEKREMVNHPAHYQSKAGIEVIDVMEAFTADLKGAEAVNTSQVIKYILRWKNKENPLQDLNKCKWYLDRLIKHVEKEAGSSSKRYNYAMIFYERESEAEETLKSMQKIIDDCGVATVADMYDITGVKNHSYSDTKYGWRNLKETKVVELDINKYAIDFPKIEEI